METDQRQYCERLGVAFCSSPANLKVGISRNVRDGTVPINGVRYHPEGDTTGWYIWAGEDLPDHDDFFLPLHVEHLEQWCPEIIKFLGLPPGWRFLKAGDYEDVWFDEAIRPVNGYDIRA